MSDPQRAPSPGEGSPPSDERARSARIEQLLLAGLDRYFAGHYEEAIDIWTRVAFLERRPGRARAYIERARGALAERQRETEELVGRGREAFEGGDLPSARALLTEAVVRGGGDVARLLLDRMDRVESRAAVTPPDNDIVSSAVLISGRWDARREWLWTTVASAGVIAGVAILGQMVSATIADWPAVPPPVALHEEEAPRPTPGDVAVQQARRLYDEGRLGEALRALEGIGVADGARVAADRLRAEWQRQAVPVLMPAPAETADASRNATSGRRE